MTEEHKCFGCGRLLESGQPHIHVGLDDWSMRGGAGQTFGLDDMLTFSFCSDCTTKTEDGWQQEAHDIEREGL